MSLDYQPRPCVGCGYCCRQATCIQGLAAMRRRATVVEAMGACPFLVERDGRWRCFLVLDGIVEPEALWIGEGCCSSLNSERVKYEVRGGK